MQRVGEFIYDRAAFPPDIASLSQMLPVINVAYHMNHTDHRDAIGNYAWASLSASSGTMTCDNPYPCSFDFGVLTSIARRFQGSAVVRHADGPCRAKGDDCCVYSVEW